MDISDNHSAAAGPAAAAVGGAGGEAAAAAATTAVLSATGQQCMKERCQSMSMSRLSLIDAPVCCALLCVGVPRVLVGSRPRVDSCGWPACELCGRRLSKVKHTHRHGPGHACHPRCKTLKRSADHSPAAVQDDSAASSLPSAAAATRPEKRVRRAKSDPGEQQAVQTFSPRRLRLRAMKRPQPERRKLKQEKEDAASSLLEQTHARRVAALAAAAAAILSFLRHISA
jgi:hypothetical protein